MPIFAQSVGRITRLKMWREFNMEKISKRTQVLIAIREFELSEGRGIGFNELVESMDLDRASISLSLDSLDDMWLIHQIDAKSVLIDGTRRKLISTRLEKQAFIDDSIRKIKAGVEGCEDV